MRLPIVSLLLASIALTAFAGDEEDAVRVVRLQLNYDNASIDEIEGVRKWSALLKSSVLASLRFINKHWAICGGSEEDKKSSTDCGKAHVTGEAIDNNRYRVNVTFIAERDPVHNVKVAGATSTVAGVVRIGLKGGIFQYTNALKVLGKPDSHLAFDEKFYCYKGFALAGSDRCIRHRNRLSDEPIREYAKPLAL